VTDAQVAVPVGIGETSGVDRHWTSTVAAVSVFAWVLGLGGLTTAIVSRTAGRVSWPDVAIALGYRRERRGRNLIQTRMPMATSSQGEKNKCRAKPTTVRATKAMRTRAMIKGTVIGLRSR
jgi:hypothetical protein